MKLLWKNSQKRETTQFVWIREGENDPLEGQINPDLNSEDPVESGSPEGASNSISLETVEYGARVNGKLSESAADIAITEERDKNSRTPGNPMGILLGSKFERQWVNPKFWIDLTLFSKDSILKNIRNAEAPVKSMMDDSVMLSTGVKSALYNSSNKSALAAISQGKKSQLEKTDSSSFEMISKSVLHAFDGALADATIEEKLGQNALKSRETFRKIRDISFWREARHRKMLGVIKGNIQKARKEVAANIERTREHLRQQRTNVVNSIEVYQTGMRNRNDSVGEAQFWDFVQKVIQNPQLFLSGGLSHPGKNLIFGTNNNVKILDAINHKFGDQVITLERSQQLTLDQETMMANVDQREKMTSQALDFTDFEGLYSSLQEVRVQTYEGDEVEQDENKVLKTLQAGLRRMGIDIRREIFRDAPVGITTSERMVLLLNFMSGHRHLLNDQKCSLEFKRTLYTWLQEERSAQEEQLRQGSQAEQGSVEQRRYAIRNALVVRDSAREAFGALDGMDAAMRSKSPDLINQKLTQMRTFVDSYKDFFGANEGEGSLNKILEYLPGDERQMIEGMTDLRNAYSGISEYMISLRAERKKYVEEVLKKLPPNVELLEAERQEAVAIRNEMREMLKQKEASISFDQQKYTAMGKAHTEVYDRVKEWDDALQDIVNRDFELPSSSTRFDVMRDIGAELDGALGLLDEGAPTIETMNVNSFNGLMRQRMHNSLQIQRLSKFETIMDANMKHQMDNLFGRVDGEVTKTLEPGMTLDYIEVADVTHTDGELALPDSLQSPRPRFNNLKFLRWGTQEGEDGTVKSLDLVYHNDTSIVRVRENENGRVIAESWSKPAEARGNLNTVVLVPGTQPDAEFVVLNMSSAGTRAATQANAGRKANRE